MKRSLLASTALCAVFVTGANAAPPAPIFNWAGFYIGGNVGGLWSTDSVDVLSPDFYTFDPGRTNTLSPSGIVGGVQAGYNYQSGNWVFGGEVDVEYLGVRGTSSSNIIFPSTLPGGAAGGPATFFNNSTSVSAGWLFTARPRIGPSAVTTRCWNALQPCAVTRRIGPSSATSAVR